MLKRVLRRIVPRGLWARLQQWRLQRLLSTYPRRVVRHRYGDVELSVELADPLGAGWYDHDWELLPEILLLRGHGLRPGARVLDLGAHQGVVALVLAEAVGPSGQVVAVEPNPHNAAQCCRNRGLNGKPRVDVVRAAVAAEDGTLLLNGGLNAQAAALGPYGRAIEVPALTIDALARRFGPPDVLFIDVEGFELQALRGARDTLAARPDCFVEVHVGCGLERAGGSVAEILAYFPAPQYELWAYSEGEARLRSFAELPPDRLRARFFLLALSVPVPAAVPETTPRDGVG